MGPPTATSGTPDPAEVAAPRRHARDMGPPTATAAPRMGGSTSPGTNELVIAATSSKQVAWWEVHEYVTAHLQVEHWPLIGSPDWCELDNDDPAKLAAVFDAAQHWALRLETSQQARCDAGRDIAAAADWAVIALEIRDRAEFYAARPWLRRIAP